MSTEQNRKIIQAIQKHQADFRAHPLTCGNDSRHKILYPTEEEGRVILKCPDCDYIQRRIPLWIWEEKKG